MMVRYGMVKVSDDMVDELRNPEIEIHVGNVPHSVVMWDRTNLFNGQMFAVPIAEEAYPYNAFQIFRVSFFRFCFTEDH